MRNSEALQRWLKLWSDLKRRLWERTDCIGRSREFIFIELGITVRLYSREISAKAKVNLRMDF